MSTQTHVGSTDVLLADPDDDTDSTAAGDPFDFDINFIEGVDASETVLMCSTSDNCGSSCGSACTTS
ncbi:FxLD family lanthipeptide [Actinospica robiniae]|uniref:FxLD family lanthipeptide n=1 Tax=Actinospica robiniae TaxID=304901 RepID=UPI0004119E06|nr:FxLD family lanthipeptide [Actinospica robiniae]